ncbi:hypothetical protein BJ165DRAFT_1313377, partial [Panaeolus papilionaceus]
QLFGDGMLKMLTGDRFYCAAEDIQQAAADKAEQVKLNRLLRAEKAELAAEFKASEMARKVRNRERRKKHKEAVSKWMKESQAAKREKRKPQWNRPKLVGIES